MYNGTFRNPWKLKGNDMGESHNQANLGHGQIMDKDKSWTKSTSFQKVRSIYSIRSGFQDVFQRKLIELVVDILELLHGVLAHLPLA